jgi:putative membrane protein insertion efficiency factor
MRDGTMEEFGNGMVASACQALYLAHRMIRSILIALIHIYRWTLSPLLAFIGGPGSGCRFTPTCSQYALEALHQHGSWPGAWLALRRLLRCHPWGGWGYDPVPRIDSSRFLRNHAITTSLHELPPAN